MSKLVSQDESFSDYKKTFVQPTPYYTVKIPGKDWKTKNKSLADPAIKAHLAGKYSVGVCGRWYPEYAIIDLDNVGVDKIERVRNALGLEDDINCMTMTSESPNSYHIFIRPVYRGKPLTLRLLQDALLSVGHEHGIEIYPQSRHTIRLPFGPCQNFVDPSAAHIKNWEDKLYWFKKLDDTELSGMKGHQIEMGLWIPATGVIPSIMTEADELLKYGLQAPSTRNDAQWRILLWCWRQNILQNDAETMVWKWIQSKHNGFSKDILIHPGVVRKEIKRQAAHIYSTYDLTRRIYPDTTHNYHHGFITKPDLEDIVKITGGSLSKMKFLFNLVRFYYPRRHRNFVNVHSDKLIEWANERTYLKYLSELEVMGIVRRSISYQVGKFSKDLKMKWSFRSDSEAVLYDGRSVETFNDAVSLLFETRDFRDLLITAGVKRTTAIMMSNLLRKSC